MGQVAQIGVSETMKQKNEEYQPPGNLLGTLPAWKPNRNSHIVIDIPRDPSRKHAKNSKQGFAGISLDNTMKLRNSRLDRDGNAI